MDDEHIKRRAYEKWEAEGRPEGEHERHWHEARRSSVIVANFRRRLRPHIIVE